MSKDLSAKYYQENQERLLKKLVKDIKIFLKIKNKKSENLSEDEKISWLSIEKRYYRIRKNPIIKFFLIKKNYNYKKVF